MSNVFVREGDGFFYAVPVTSTHLTVVRGDTREECTSAAEAKGYDVVDETDHVEPVTGAVLHLRAPNDTNGNPRRLYVVLGNTLVLDVYDEGYRGKPKELKDCQPFPVNVPASEYNAWKRDAKESGRFHHS